MSRENVPNHKQLAQLSKNVRTRHTPIKLKEQNAEEQQRARLSLAGHVQIKLATLCHFWCAASKVIQSNLCNINLFKHNTMVRLIFKSNWPKNHHLDNCLHSGVIKDLFRILEMQIL